MHGAAAGIRPSNDQSDENLPHHGSIHPCEFVVAAEGAGVFAQCSKAPDHSGLQSVETIVGIEATFPSEVANDPHVDGVEPTYPSMVSDGSQSDLPHFELKDVLRISLEESADSAWARFEDAGIYPRRRVMEVNEYVRRGEPGDRTSIGWWQWRVATVTESEPVQWFLFILVLMNSIVIGVEADFGTKADLAIWASLDFTFVILFALEIGLRMFALGSLFWEDRWNTVDFTIVSISTVEVFTRSAMARGHGSFLSTLRLVRVVRIVRLLNTLEGLSLLTVAFVRSVKKVFWVGVFLSIILFLLSVVCRDVFGNSATLLKNPDYQPEWFSNVPRAMLTIFQLLTLDDWANLMRPVGHSMGLSWIFTLFVIILFIMIMNLTVAIFIDELLKQTSRTLTKAEKRAIKMKTKQMQICKDALAEFDLNTNGLLDVDEIRSILNVLDMHPKLRLVFDDAGMPLLRMKDELDLGDLQAENMELDVSTMIDIVTTSNNPTRRRDMFELHYRIQKLERDQTEAGEAVEQLVESLDSLDGRMQKQMDMMMMMMNSLMDRGLSHVASRHMAIELGMGMEMGRVGGQVSSCCTPQNSESALWVDAEDGPGGRIPRSQPDKFDDTMVVSMNNNWFTGAHVKDVQASASRE